MKGDEGKGETNLSRTAEREMNELKGSGEGEGYAGEHRETGVSRLPPSLHNALQKKSEKKEDVWMEAERAAKEETNGGMNTGYRVSFSFSLLLFPFFLLHDVVFWRRI